AIIAACPAELDRYVLTLDEAPLLQAATECFKQVHGVLWRARAHEPYHWHCRLLRARCERPRGRAADERYELAAPHSITSSARASSDGGTVRPSAFAVLRLIVSSNFVGCSTGSSAGLAPCKIRCTYQAPRLNMSGRIAPYAMRPPARASSLVWYIAGSR